MTPLNQTDDITVVTAPDFATPRGGSVLVILGGEDLDPKAILHEVTRQWPIDDPLVVYVQPIVNGSDLARAKAIFATSSKCVLVVDEMTPLLALMLTIMDDDSIVLASDTQWGDNAAYMGLNVADDAEAAIHFLIHGS